MADADASHSRHGRPEVYAVRRQGSRWTVTRRDLVAAAATAAAGVAGCGRRGRSSQAEQANCDQVLAHTSLIHGLAISRDARLLASASDDNTVKLWSLPDGVALLCRETQCPIMQVEPCYATERGEYADPPSEDADAFVEAFL